MSSVTGMLHRPHLGPPRRSTLHTRRPANCGSLERMSSQQFRTSGRSSKRPLQARDAGSGTGFLFILATIASVVGLAATYYFFVRTTMGQFIDESALVEATELGGTAGRASTSLLDMLPMLSLAIATLMVIFVTVARRRWTAAGIAVVACIGANAATQILKFLIPDRPDRGVQTLELNSLPSGHTTLAASAAAAVFLMVSPRWRPLAGFLGSTFAVATGVSTLINQWHRPADVVAAFLVVGAVMLPAGWLILRTGSSWNAWKGYGEHWAASRLWVWLTVAALLIAIAVAGYSLMQVMPGLSADSTVDYFWAGTAFIVIAGYLSALGGTWLFGLAARKS
ncbi:phosphatase PAP2 family protein [Arthrobacter sp. fls2-241-R2A-172]|uniref:phosphatase PAP2 family protein n=1 Tax=Arthrobacter sp. fls2-241-R2A-172 TaxID=3040325 RepID=UPI00254E37D3|nr:phosphatase PAP2 family protein [Arthrobacter sp. fls2-241-R2A-172]